MIRHHLHVSLQYEFKSGTLIERQGFASDGFYAVGIHRFAVDARLIVHMGAGGLAGSPDFGNCLPLFHKHALLDQQAAAVSVIGLETVGMADDHQFAVAASPASKFYSATGGGMNGRTVGGAVIDTGVALVFFRDGMVASY